MSATTKHYPEHDHAQLDVDGNYYCRHVAAMTSEGLHSKSDIAAQLGARDREIDLLHRANDRLLEALQQRVVNETMLQSLEVKPGELFIGVEGGAAGLLVAAFGDMLLQADAPNYVEMQFTFKGEPMLVHLQRRNGKTPHQLRVDAVHAVADLVSAIEGASVAGFGVIEAVGMAEAVEAACVAVGRVAPASGEKPAEMAKQQLGELSIQAPTGQVPRAWTEGEKDACRQAMRRIVDLENEMGKQQAGQFPWGNFPAYLIDKCEGDTISEEGIQRAVAGMAKDSQYTKVQQVAAPLAAPGVGEWSKGWNACREAMLRGEVACGTCNGFGLIGGPSFYAPDEGRPCPDCSSSEQAGEVQGDGDGLWEVEGITGRWKRTNDPGRERAMGMNVRPTCSNPAGQPPKFTTEDGPCWHHAGKAFIVTVDGDSLQLMVTDGPRIEFIGDARPYRVPAQGIDLGPLKVLVSAVEEEFCSPATEEMEPDDSTVSYPEENCPITFGMIRAARRALDGQRDAAPGVSNG